MAGGVRDGAAEGVESKDMASHAGIASVCEAVAEWLRGRCGPAEVRVARASELEQGIEAGVTVTVYGVEVDPARRAGLRERETREGLPVSVQLLLTVWGTEAAAENELAGRVMTALDESPVLTAEMLNKSRPGVFEAGERVQLTIQSMGAGEVCRLWRALARRPYQLSIAVEARGLALRPTSSSLPT